MYENLNFFIKFRKQRGGGRTSSSLVQTAATSLPGIATLESASPCSRQTGAGDRDAKKEQNNFKTSNILLLTRHVVNCVQPHPTQPLIATSGIDYDVKVTLHLPFEIDLGLILDSNNN